MAEMKVYRPQPVLAEGETIREKLDSLSPYQRHVFNSAIVLVVQDLLRSVKEAGTEQETK